MATSFIRQKLRNTVVGGLTAASVFAISGPAFSGAEVHSECRLIEVVASAGRQAYQVKGKQLKSLLAEAGATLKDMDLTFQYRNGVVSLKSHVPQTQAAYDKIYPRRANYSNGIVRYSLKSSMHVEEVGTVRTTLSAKYQVREGYFILTGTGKSKGQNHKQTYIYTCR